MNIYAEEEANIEEWKEHIRKEWEKSKQYPRKMKKKVRKSLHLDWSIANYKVTYSF
jgi:hypothetical protein